MDGKQVGGLFKDRTTLEAKDLKQMQFLIVLIQNPRLKEPLETENTFFF